VDRAAERNIMSGESFLDASISWPQANYKTGYLYVLDVSKPLLANQPEAH
jgi:hypothetical protein